MRPDSESAQAAEEIVALLTLCQFLPMMMTLSTIGTEMERRGEISLLLGEDYAQRALVCLTEQYLSTKENKQ